MNSKYINIEVDVQIDTVNQFYVYPNIKHNEILLINTKTKEAVLLENDINPFASLYIFVSAFMILILFIITLEK